MKGTNQICSSCGEYKVLENYEIMICSSCSRSKRKDAYEDLYPFSKKMFLEMCIRQNLVSPIHARPITLDFDIHHMKGRTGFADEWAKEHDIPLLLDPRFFLAVTREEHTYIEEHPEEAIAKGWSMTRQDILT